MSSQALGATTSGADAFGGPEVTHVSSNGIWVLASGREHFLPYDDFPWFKDASISQILRVEEPVAGHFYWPDLDVDLSVEIIEHAERFPLSSRKPKGPDA